MKHVRLWLIAFVCVMAPALAAADDDEKIFPKKLDCSKTDEPKNCTAHQRLMPMIAGGALGGRRASMRAVARYAGEFANGIFIQDQKLSCSWRMVIVGSPRIRSTPDDQSAFQKTCTALNAAGYAQAEDTARQIARRVFRTSAFVLPANN